MSNFNFKPLCKTRFRSIDSELSHILQCESVITDLQTDNSNPSHGIMKPIDVNFVNDAYLFTTEVMKLISFYESDKNPGSTVDFLPLMEQLLIWGCSNQGSSMMKDIKRAMVYTISEFLFQKASDMDGIIITNNMIPCRINNNDFACLLLNYEYSTCKLKKITKFLKDTTDTQFAATRDLICEMTANWRGCAEKTIESLYSNTMEFELELERGGQNLNPPDEEDYDSDLPSAVLPGAIEDMQLNVGNMSPIQEELRRYREFPRQAHKRGI